MEKSGNSIVDEKIKVYNLSSKILTEGEINLLALGTKFVPAIKTSAKEQKIDILKFSRKLILKAMFFGKPSNDESLIRPRSLFVPKVLKQNEVLRGVIEDLEILANEYPSQVDYSNIKDNLTLEQGTSFDIFKKRKDIVYFKADKGSGVVLLDPDFYKDKVLSILNTDKYVKLNRNVDKCVSLGLRKLVKNHESMLTKKERLAITNFEPVTTNLYALPKIHKSKILKDAIKHNDGSYIHLPRPSDIVFRLIFGGWKSPTSGLADLLNMLLGPFVDKVDSRVKDVFDFINKIPTFEREDLPFIELISVDVKSMYENLEQNLGIPALRYYLNQYKDLLPSRFSIDFVITAMKFVLENNTGYFNGDCYKQLTGTATGIKPAPRYADLAMGYLEINLFYTLRSKLGSKVALHFWKFYRRYLDDGLIFWDTRLCPFENVFEIMNSLNRSIKFTMERDVNKLPYLDIEIYRTEKGFETMVYNKPTDSGNYLPFGSNHPRHTKTNIPFSLARRVKTLTNDDNLSKVKLEDLSSKLKDCGYPFGLVNCAVDTAMSLSTSDLRNKKPREEGDDLLVFVHTFDPAYNSLMNRIRGITSRLITSNVCRPIFGGSKFIESCREPLSLLGHFQHSRFDETRPKVNIGVTRCGHAKCKLCTEILVGTSVYFSKVKVSFYVKSEMDCTVKNVVYALFCDGCGEDYIGQTVCLRDRMNTHRNKSKTDDPAFAEVSRHLYRCGKGFRVFPLVKVKEDCIYTRLVEEDLLINLFKPSLNTDKRNLLHLQN
ncbi:MAG: hypothetical protein HRT42_13390 [Campylobacteraceae bacterium]|nr:hypothetical protein [Campylobacteraceae bacterium]